MLNINKTVENRNAVFQLEGRLDTSSAPVLEAELKQTLAEIDTLVVDMEKVEYVSSAGLRVLLFARKRLYGKGSMKIVRVNELVQEVFDVTGFSHLLPIE